MQNRFKELFIIAYAKESGIGSRDTVKIFSSHKEILVDLMADFFIKGDMSIMENKNDIEVIRRFMTFIAPKLLADND